MVHAVNSSLAAPVGPDFSDAADKALNVVVQINAQRKVKTGSPKMDKTTFWQQIHFFRSLI